jgi:hypothetical protein
MKITDEFLVELEHGPLHKDSALAFATHHSRVITALPHLIAYVRALRKLKPYAQHQILCGCQLGVSEQGPCDCGLEAIGNQILGIERGEVPT